MAKAVQSILLRWDTDFVDEIRAVAGPRGMSGFIRRAVEAVMNTPESQQTVRNYQRMTTPAVDTDFDKWGA